MKINKKSLFLSSIIVLMSLLVAFVIVKAATTLNPPGAPNPSLGTMYTLEDVYQKLLVGTSAGTHTLAPASSPAGTMHTLTDIYNEIPANSQVCSGTNGGTATCGGAPALVWQTDPGLSLCWDAQDDTTDNGAYNKGCTPSANGSGGLWDPNGGNWAGVWIDQSYAYQDEVADNVTDNVWECTNSSGCADQSTGSFSGERSASASDWTQIYFYGAVEYCTHLNTAGTTPTNSIGIWSLPTESQLLAGLSDQFILGTTSGFQDGYSYWSGSASSDGYAWSANYSYGYVGNLNYYTSYNNSVRCAH